MPPEAPVGLPDARDPVEAAVPAAAAPARPKARRQGFGWFFWACVAWVALVSLLALVADFLPLEEPDRTVRDMPRLSGPSLEHPMGLDASGFDLLSRVVYGGRVSLIIGVGTIIIGFLVGGSLGLTAGYFRGRLDAFFTGATNVMLAFPQLLLALAIVSFAGVSIRNILIALSILAVPSLYRVTRAATLAVADREFVTAARSLGATDFRIITREILPNVVPPMLSFGLLAVAIVIVAEGALAFLGLSVSDPTLSWGGLIQRGSEPQTLENAPHVALFPSGVMFVTLVALNTIGDRLSRRFDVRESTL